MTDHPETIDQLRPGSDAAFAVGQVITIHTPAHPHLYLRKPTGMTVAAETVRLRIAEIRQRPEGCDGVMLWLDRIPGDPLSCDGFGLMTDIDPYGRTITIEDALR